MHGLGGIGKTHLALEYAYRHGLEYTAVFWITAESAETILTSFWAITEQLKLPEVQQKADQQQIVRVVRRWFSTHSKWLLIWDNLEDIALLQSYLPPVHQGVILITTRRQTLGTIAYGVELPPMRDEEGIFFLLRRARLLAITAFIEQLEYLAQTIPVEYGAAQELVATMGGLPLALDQVGAYVEETSCSLADYLELYQTRQAELLRRRGEAVTDYRASVITTWSLSFEKVEQTNAAAANLLRWCAFLYPEAIAEEIFLEKTESQDEWRGLVAVDAFQLHEAIRVASAYSLLKRNVQEHTLSLHRLVQVVLREGMSEQEREQWQQQVTRRLNTLFPAEASHGARRQCERLLPHILMYASALPDQGSDKELANVLRKAADYLRTCARYKEAEPLYQQARRIWEQIQEPEHPEITHLLYGLARLYYEQGKYEEAEAFYQRSLHIREQALGPEHPDVAFSLNRLATLYYEQRRYEEAEPLYQRALHIREHVW